MSVLGMEHMGSKKSRTWGKIKAIFFLSSETL